MKGLTRPLPERLPSPEFRIGQRELSGTSVFCRYGVCLVLLVSDPLASCTAEDVANCIFFVRNAMDVARTSGGPTFGSKLWSRDSLLLAYRALAKGWMVEWVDDCKSFAIIYLWCNWLCVGGEERRVDAWWQELWAEYGDSMWRSSGRLAFRCVLTDVFDILTDGDHPLKLEARNGRDSCGFLERLNALIVLARCRISGQLGSGLVPGDGPFESNYRGIYPFHSGVLTVVRSQR